MSCVERLQKWHALATSLVLILCVAELGCRQGSEEPRTPPHIVLVVVDTLRRDHVGTYGYERETSPVIDELGGRGLVFERAIAQAPWTLPSLMSLFTSRYPARAVQARGGILPRLREEANTLAEVLRGAGYATASVTTNPYNADAFNLMQGFGERRWRGSAPADWVVDEAIGVLGAFEGTTFFLYLHFMDVHDPREPPPPYDSMFPASDGRLHEPRHGRFVEFYDGNDIDSPEFLSYRSHTLALYDGSVRFVDAQIGRLLRYLEEHGLAEQSVIAITSDHGEEFWDHAELGRSLGLPAYHSASAYGIGHGHTLFPELIEVPLVLVGRGVPVGRVSTQVRLLDLAPTLAQLAGAGQVEGAAGVSLVERVDRLSDLPAVSETWTPWAVHQTLVTPTHQFLRVDGRSFLFEHRGELTDVTSMQSERASQLGAELDESLRDAVRPLVEPSELDESLTERLRALGYVR